MIDPMLRCKEVVRRLLLKPNTRYKFRELCKSAHVTAEIMNAALDSLRKEGVKIRYSRLDRAFFLSTVPTPYSDYFDMTWLPLKGKLGVISDTHLCSCAERLDALNAAYDDFAKRKITTVIHSGDISDGWDVYKGHSQFVKLIGVQKQAAYVKKHYPQRKGMKTFFIGGNHDLRAYEHSGVDVCSLIVSDFIDQEGKVQPERKDLVYLGQYSRFLLMQSNVTIHVLHPRGGNTYSKSYAQQKRGREMKMDSRPNLQMSGHFHQFNYTKEDITHMLAMPGMQDETEFFIRQGYRRDLGYGVLEYEIQKGRFSRLAVDMVEVE